MARSTAVSRPASSRPGMTRTMAPASLTSITGANDDASGTVTGGTASLTIGTKPGVAGVVVVRGGLGKSWRIARHQPNTCCERPPSRHLGYPRSRNQRLRDDPCLLIRRPAPAPARPRQNLDPPISALRVIINVKHNDSSKLSASRKSSTAGNLVEQGHQSPAYA
jgi:hypothetical protein